MSDFLVGQECEMKRYDEDRVLWARVRIVSDDGKSVWVKYAERIGNGFPVPRADLRPAPSLSAGENGR